MKKIAANLPLKAKIATAAISLFLERCVDAFSWLFVWGGFFICVWLVGYHSRETTMLFWLGMLVIYFLGLRKLEIPTRSEIIHRVETASHLKHRPLQSIDDTPATSGRAELWNLEKSRQKNLLKNLRHSTPDLELADKDPFALRIAFILIIFCAIFVAPDLWTQKIKNGLFLPEAQDTGPVEQPFAQLHITPPAYSGLKTVVLNQSSNQPVEILSGSTVKAEIQTSWRQPHIKMGDQRLPLKRKNDSDTWILETSIPMTNEIKITSLGITRFSQKIKWVNDTPPIIGWNGEIGIFASGEMKIPLKIADDFGIRKLTLRGILSPLESIPFFGSPVSIEKKVNLSIRNSSTDLNAVFDTTGHEWAGKRVSIMVEAEDFAGNVSETSPIDMTLPQRNFKNPLAATLASIRSDLLALRGNVKDIADSVEEILFRPDLYKWDIMTTLGLRSIDSRLHYSDKKEDLQSSASMLWSLAMRMEDGKISETQDFLREALDKLQSALQKGADKTEITKLMQEMQQALIRHLQTIARKLQDNANNSPLPSGMRYNMNLGGLAEFLQKIQDEIKNGDTQSAMNKLNELQQLADTMGSSMAQGMPKDVQEMMQNLNDLQNVITQQKKLLDKTRQIDTEKSSSLTSEQKDIANKVNTISGKLNQNAQPLIDAENQMAQAATSLNEKNKEAAIEHQQKALELLEKTSQQMQQQLKKKMQNMMGISMGSSGGQPDPLGRERGQVTDSDVKIPGGASRKKTDQIIKTLREREGDMKRPLEERNYYQRLLKQW